MNKDLLDALTLVLSSGSERQEPFPIVVFQVGDELLIPESMTQAYLVLEGIVEECDPATDTAIARVTTDGHVGLDFLLEGGFYPLRAIAKTPVRVAVVTPELLEEECAPALRRERQRRVMRALARHSQRARMAQDTAERTQRELEEACADLDAQRVTAEKVAKSAMEEVTTTQRYTAEIEAWARTELHRLSTEAATTLHTLRQTEQELADLRGTLGAFQQTLGKDLATRLASLEQHLHAQTQANEVTSDQTLKLLEIFQRHAMTLVDKVSAASVIESLLPVFEEMMGHSNAGVRDAGATMIQTLMLMRGHPGAPKHSAS